MHEGSKWVPGSTTYINLPPRGSLGQKAAGSTRAALGESTLPQGSPSIQAFVLEKASEAERDARTLDLAMELRCGAPSRVRVGRASGEGGRWTAGGPTPCKGWERGRGGFRSLADHRTINECPGWTTLHYLGISTGQRSRWSR